VNENPAGKVCATMASKAPRTLSLPWFSTAVIAECGDEELHRDVELRVKWRNSASLQLSMRRDRVAKRLDPVMRHLDGRALTLNGFAKIRGQHQLERLSELCDGDSFAAFAIHENGVPVPARDCRLQIDPAPMQGARHAARILGLLLPRP